MSASAPLIEMEVPPGAEFVRTVRLVVAGIGGVARFNLEEIEDLKLAAGEACYAALPGPGPVRLSARLLPEGVEIRVGPVSVHGPAPDSQVGLDLVERVVDEFSVETLGEERWIRFLKRHRNPESGL